VIKSNSVQHFNLSYNINNFYSLKSFTCGLSQLRFQFFNATKETKAHLYRLNIFQSFKRAYSLYLLLSATKPVT